MTTNSEQIEYELIDITFELPYELSEDDAAYLVGEDTPIQTVKASAIEYDNDGIPMGTSHEEIVVRRQIIHDFIQQWRAEHVNNPRIFNDDLKDYVKINQLFMLESVAHAAERYLSTQAVLRMEEIIKKAKSIGLAKKKEGNKNQKPFQHMVVLLYRSEELGNVKMVVGIRPRTLDKVQYSITVPSPGTPFIDKNMRKDAHAGNRKKKKRSK